MTDVTPSDDELVSSYLDHEATRDEVARVEADPGLMARVGEMRTAIAFVATPPPLPEADLDRIRAEAVAAMAPAPVVDMAAARAKRLERRNRLLAVAAGVLLFGGIVAGIASIDSSDDDDSAGDSSSADVGSTDDSADDGGSDDSSFSTFGDADAGDAASADGMAEAEMAAEDTSMDSASAEDEAVNEADSDDGGADDEGAPASRLSTTPAFDPLTDDLGGFASVDELAAAVEDFVAAMIVDEESEFAPEEFLPLTTCGETLAVALAADAGLDVDLAEATVNAVHYTIVLGHQIDTGDIVGRLAPSDTCSPATELFAAP